NPKLAPLPFPLCVRVSYFPEVPMLHRQSRVTQVWRRGALCMSILGAGATWLAASPAGDTAPGHASYHEINVLGTSLDLTVCAAKKEDADGAHQIILDEVERLRKTLSTYDAASDLSKLNATRDAVKVSPEVIAVLRQYETWMSNTK